MAIVIGIILLVIALSYMTLVDVQTAKAGGSKIYMSANIHYLANQTCQFQITLYNNGSQDGYQQVFTKIEYSNGDAEILVTNTSVMAASEAHLDLFMEPHTSVNKQFADARCYLL
jgi:hypothetical protein